MSDDGAPPTESGPLTPDLAGLRRLERRIARSMSLKAIGRRLWESAPAILQIVAAVLAAFSIAHFGFGHASPVLAVTVTITSLGFTRDARPVRVLRSVTGILLGVAVAAGAVQLLGQGWWQLGVLLLVVLVIARIVATDATFAIVAATPAALTVLLPVPDGGPWLRVVDAVIGGAVALVVTILIPRDPRRSSLRDARALYSVLGQAVESVVDGLREGGIGAAELGLARLRRTQPLVDAWSESLDTALAVARISPFLRSRLPELDRQTRALRGGDAAARHLRLIARRCEFILRDGGRHEELADLLAQVGRAIGLLGEELDRLELAGAARSVLRDLGHRLDPATVLPHGSASESAVVVQLRPLVVDLLVASGMPIAEAHGTLPAV
ncbi:MAG: FUSC family protein [Microbacteriaceae bacterium]|nr:FUSC family protein [Microbacteriaceae bacterium]